MKTEKIDTGLMAEDAFDAEALVSNVSKRLWEIAGGDDPFDKEEALKLERTLSVAGKKMDGLGKVLMDLDLDGKVKPDSPLQDTSGAEAPAEAPEKGLFTTRDLDDINIHIHEALVLLEHLTNLESTFKDDATVLILYTAQDKIREARKTLWAKWKAKGGAEHDSKE